MKYVRKFENFELNKDWKDASKEEIEKSSIPAYKETQDYKNIMNDDIDFIMTKIKEKFPKEDVDKMLSNEIIEWIPDGKDEDWYKENNNGEAEDVIIDDLIDWFEKNYNPITDVDKVKESIKKEYNF
jgi:hypothetical protein